MNRRIEWQRTGGKTHRVTIREDKPISCEMWLQLRTHNVPWIDQAILTAQANVNANTNTSLGYVGLGLFGSLFGGL